MRAKSITGAIAGLAAAALLVGCSSGGGSAEGDGGSDGTPQDVKVWLYPVIADEAKHKAFWDGAIEAFEAENTTINVEYEIFPWAKRDESLQTAIAAGKGPDLVYLIPDQLVAYEKSIEPLDKYLTDEYKSSILPNVVDSVTLEAGMMGAPILTSAQTMLCNAQAFEAAGVTEYPETWDDMREIGPKFAEKGLYLLNYPATAENTLNLTFYPLLWQAGGSVYKDGQVGFNSPEGIAALGFLNELVEMGAVDPDPLTTQVATEQTAMAQNRVGCTWANGPTEVESFWGTENVVVMPPLKGEKSITYGTVGSLSMLNGSKVKDAAGKFAEYATSAEVIKPYLLEGGYFSALDIDPLYEPDTLLGQVEKHVPATTVGELDTTSRELMGVLSPEIQAALLGQKSVEDALAAAETAAQPLLK